jgi:hypothetical protein
MSSSEQRRSVNRANALKSTGPVTLEGKNASSRNAIRHGLFSTRVVLIGEDAKAYDAMRADHPRRRLFRFDQRGTDRATGRMSKQGQEHSLIFVIA